MIELVRLHAAWAVLRLSGACTRQAGVLATVPRHRPRHGVAAALLAFAERCAAVARRLTSG